MTDLEAFTAAYMEACKGKPSDYNEIGLHYARSLWDAAIKHERAKNDVLLEEIAHRLTQQKIWNGSGWTYHNVPPFVYLKLVENIGAARKESAATLQQPGEQ